MTPTTPANAGPPAPATDTVWRLAICTGGLDWSLRQRCSKAAYDVALAHAWITDYLAAQMARLERAAAAGARLIVAPEYFAGTELFTTTPAQHRALLRHWEPLVLNALHELARRRQVWVACAMECLWGEEYLETGILAHPGDDAPWRQLKQTCVAPGHPLARGYELWPLPGGLAGLFTCSDLTSYPEDPITAAKAGMSVLLCPGCGFAGPHWEAFITTRAIDLGVPILYADDNRGLVVDHLGQTVLRASAAGEVLTGELTLPARTPVTRLFSFVGRRHF